MASEDDATEVLISDQNHHLRDSLYAEVGKIF